MNSGIITQYNKFKKFGFVTQPGYSQDIFIHIDRLDPTSDTNLKEGLTVQYDLVETDVGPVAHNIKII